MKMKDLENLSPKTKSVPLRGFIVKDDADSVWIEDKSGTWIVKKSDIVGENKNWNPQDSRFKGKPTCIFIKDGAEIFEIRPTKVDLSARPITLGDPRDLPEVLGDRDLQKLAERWARHLGFRPGETLDSTCTPWTTACCWETGDWQTDCQADDSSCD